jgi:predicted metalloprotease
MKWRGRRGSSNIEDRRTQSASRGPTRLPGGLGRGGFGGFPGGGRIGGGRGLPIPRSRTGLIVLIAVIVIGALLGGQQGGLGPSGTGLAPPSAPTQLSEADREIGEFVSVVLADTEEVWTEVFRDDLGRSYDPPVLVLYRQGTTSGCGFANAAVGPFYCPADRKVYLDTDFFRTLRADLGAGGDFAQAYVIAHEIGHHVQGELGILEETHRLRASLPQAEANAVSVRTELMADCFAGLWARRAEERFGSLEPGDVEEAMNAAARIGDDALQRRAGDSVRPDSFTHGSSAERQAWFARGWRSGDLAACDTFADGR